MAHMSDNAKCSSRDFSDILQLTNWILDSGARFRMVPQVSDYISGSLEDRDKHIEVADGHHVTEIQKGQVRIKMCDNNRDTLIVTLYNLLLEPDLCNRLSTIITLINLGNNYLFQKGFCMV